jgi:hypothetical protein
MKRQVENVPASIQARLKNEAEAQIQEKHWTPDNGWR